MVIIGKATWSGDGTSPRLISDANGNTGTPIAVFVHGVNQGEQIWISGMTVSVPFGLAVASLYSQGILGASIGNFSIGSDNVVNKSGTTYFADLIYQDTDNRVNFGSYTGTAASRNITTTNTTPWDLVITVPSASYSDKCVWKTTPMGSTSSSDLSSTGQILATQIYGLGTGTFAVSSLNTVNRSGEVFFYLAMASTANVFVPFSYTGIGATQNVGAIGFHPSSGLIKGNTNAAGLHRHASEINPGMSVGGGAESANGLYAFFNGGFSVSTSNTINGNGTTYYAGAFLDTTPAVGGSVVSLPISNRLLMGL